jgi:hypothetical protein
MLFDYCAATVTLNPILSKGQSYYKAGNHCRPPAPGLPCCSSWIEVFRKSIPTFTQHVRSEATLVAAGRNEVLSCISMLYGAVVESVAKALLGAQPVAAMAGTL